MRSRTQDRFASIPSQWLGGRSLLNALLIIALVGIPLPSTAKVPESPQLQDLLGGLGYIVVDPEKSPKKENDDPSRSALETSDLPVRILSAAIRLPLKSERKIDDPWIQHSYEIICGEGRTVEREGSMMLRFDYVVFDESMKKVDRLRMGVEVQLRRGESSVREVSHGFQLEKPMKLATEACLVLGRENEAGPWRVLFFSTSRLNHIE